MICGCNKDDCPWCQMVRLLGEIMRAASDDILLPCPFCGSLRVGVFFSRNTYVECRACGTRGPQIGAHVETDDQGAQRATQKWNQRIPHKA